MALNWTNSDLVRDLEQLKELERKTSDPILKYRINESMEHIKSIIKERNEITSRLPLKKLLQYCTIDYEQKHELLDLVGNFIHINWDLYNKTNVFELPKRRINIDDYFSLIHDFYKCFDNEWYSLFLKEFDYKDSRFRFEKPLGDREACIYFIPYLRKSYLEVTNEKTVSSLSCAVHEYGHAIGAHMNSSRFIKNEDVSLEVESIFFELIADDYFENILEGNDFNILRNNRLLTYIELSMDLMDNSNVVKQWLDIKKDSLKRLKEKLDSYGLSSLANIKDGYNSTEDYIYAISINIAMELYFIFQLDQELALDYLKQIIMGNINGVELVRNDYEYKSNLIIYGKDVGYYVRALKK